MVSHGPVSAAVIFCFAWTGLALVNNVSLKQRPGWSYAELTLFCWVRVIAFACEAAASHHPDRLRSALFEGFYDGGFFLLLVVLYGVLKKWLEEAHNHTYLPFSNLSQTAKGRLQTSFTALCWCMPILSALGIGAAAASLSGNADNASDALHDVSGAGFLVVLAVFLAAVLLVMVNVGRSSMAATAECLKELAPLSLVALLLMLKVCFQLACTTYTDAWVNPSLFYPLSALPEILAVLILSRHSLLPIITHGRINPGSTLAGPNAPMNPAASSAYTGEGFFPGSQGEGYPQQPYEQGRQEQGYTAQSYQNAGHEQGALQEPYQHAIHEQARFQGPYQSHRQSQNIPQGTFLQRQLPRATYDGQHAQHGQHA